MTIKLTEGVQKLDYHAWIKVRFQIQLRPADVIYTNFSRGRALDFLSKTFWRTGGDLDEHGHVQKVSSRAP